MLTKRKSEWLLTGLGVVAFTLIVTDFGGPVRAVFVLAAWLLLPGWVLVRRLKPVEPASRLCFTVGASASLAAIIGLLMVWMRFWHPIPVGSVLLLISAGLVMLPDRRTQYIGLRTPPSLHVDRTGSP